MNPHRFLSLLPGVLLSLSLLCPCPVAAERGVYSLQVGAYKHRTGAERTVEELRERGHDAFYREEDRADGQSWHVVYIERFSSKGEAAREGRVLKDLGLISDYAVKALDRGEGGGTPPSRNDLSIHPTRLHIGSFEEKQNAEGLVDLLVQKRIEAFWRVEEEDGKIWYRVYIGGFKNEKEALEAGRELRERGLIDFFSPLATDKPAPSKGRE